MVMFHKGEPLELASFHKVSMVMFHKGEPLELASFHKNGDVS